MAKKGGLGRRYGDILSDAKRDHDRRENYVAASVLELDLTLVHADPSQPRRSFDTQRLEELASSIVEHGLIQPISVYEDDEGGYIVLAGERRLRASKIAGLKNIRAIIIDKPAKTSELALIENIQREDLNPIELANAYATLLKNDAELTHERLAKRLGKSRAAITNTLRLLGLSKEVQDLLINEKLSSGHAKALLGLDEAGQKLALNSILGQKLSVREGEKLVSKLKNKNESKGSVKNMPLDPKLVRELGDALGRLGLSAKFGKGKLNIKIPNDASLSRLVEKLH